MAVKIFSKPESYKIPHLAKNLIYFFEFSHQIRVKTVVISHFQMTHFVRIKNLPRVIEKLPTMQRKVEQEDWNSGVLLSRAMEYYAQEKYGSDWLTTRDQNPR